MTRARRKPVWQPGPFAHLSRALRGILKQTSFGRLAVAAFVLPALFYIYREVIHDAVVIDPFTVPKRFEETGLTSEVMANRIGDALRRIEVETQTRMRKDSLRSLHDEGSMPDVEIPGTKLSVKTLIDILRNIFAIYPKHISGDVIVPVTDAAKGGPSIPKTKATVTVYVTQGRNRSQAASFPVSAEDLGLLAQRTAEAALRQLNPYVLAAYREEHQEYEKAIQILEEMTQNPVEDDRSHMSAAFHLWGLALYNQQRYEEAAAKYQKAIEIDPKYASSYNNWGLALYYQNRYEEAAAKYRKAIDLDPKFAFAYHNWVNVLYAQKRYEEADAKYQKAIDLDPKFADTYYN